jgi:hypothetical protein
VDYFRLSFGEIPAVEKLRSPKTTAPEPFFFKQSEVQSQEVLVQKILTKR